MERTSALDVVSNTRRWLQVSFTHLTHYSAPCASSSGYVSTAWCSRRHHECALQRKKTRQREIEKNIMQRLGQGLKERSTRRWWRENWITAAPWVVVIGLVLIAALTALISDSFRDEVQEVFHVLTSGDQQRIRDYLRGYGAWGPIVSVALMVTQVIFAPIPASVVQLANGVVYGKFWGTVLNFVGQMAGAIMAFYIARALGKRTVEKMIGKISGNAFENWVDRWGGKALFVVRAIPGMPSDFISYVSGLTNIRPRTYILATAAGYIPQSILYAWLGDSAMEWFWWIIIGGFVVSGLIGLIAWFVQRRNRTARRRSLSEPKTTSA